MKKNFKVTVKKIGRNAGKTIRNAGAAVIATAVTLATAEAAFVGAEMAQNDAQFVGKVVKNKFDKTEPIYYRKGYFGKKQIGYVDKKSGEIKPYTGSKVPTNTKAVRL